MDNYLIHWKLDEAIDVPDEKDNRDAVVKALLLDRLDKEKVEIWGYHFDHGEEYDNHDDGGHEPIFENETFFEMRLAVETRPRFFLDGGGHLSHYVHEALKQRPSHIDYVFEREDNGSKRTTIGFRITE